MFKSRIKPFEFIRENFKNRVVDEVFELPIPENYTIAQMRASTKEALKHTNFKYKTTVNDNKLYILILEA